MALTKVLCNPNTPDCCFPILKLKIGDLYPFCVVLFSDFGISLNIVVKMNNSNNMPRKKNICKNLCK